jgi:hypothetical protein
MAYLGMVPSEHSTGPKRRVGAITNAGDVHARTLLIEAAHSYRFPARVARHKLAAIDAVPEAVCAIAWKAQTRLCHRYRQMMAKDKPRQVVVTAIARELAGFVWSIACITSDPPVKNFAVTAASDEVCPTAAVGRAPHRQPLKGTVRRVGRPPTSRCRAGRGRTGQGNPRGSVWNTTSVRRKRQARDAPWSCGNQPYASNL